ncbi:YodC family protein [Cupriavidus sp. amp6]|uniref:YodC family protein n=1 Tax=Cupriavidus sp. amp6 TaxID=388051 RepID=UPI000428D934|nr:DUF2158 domain-containing protein [Cupriavidus sp. amp6]
MSTTAHATGTVVKLKSGGPEMTVKYWQDTNESYTCQWFAGRKLEQGNFKHDQLVVINEPSGA